MKHSDYILKDFLVTGEKFNLKNHYEIDGLLKTEPSPPNHLLSKYYESDAYISHSDSSKGMINTLYYWVKNYSLKKKFSLISQASQGKKILDYGCGTGEFVSFLNSKKMNAFGFEPNTNAFKIAKEKNPERIFNSNQILKNEKFDVITLWHVLEHVPDLNEVIEQLKNSLNPDGKLFVAVPNYASFDAEYYQEFWAAYDVPRHLWHFNQKSMQTLFNNFGMIIEKVHPMWFDAFYVSLLSEKYKRSSLGFLKAMCIGFISNVKAMNSGEFSSLIYQIQVKNVK